MGSEGQGEGEVAPKILIRQGGVFLVRNGKERRLCRAQRVSVLYDDVDAEPPMAKVEFWEPDFDGMIEVSELMAAALLSADGERQLAFLTDEDAKALRDLTTHLAETELNNWATATRKIVALLDKRDEIPF